MQAGSGCGSLARVGKIPAEVTFASALVMLRSAQGQRFLQKMDPQEKLLVAMLHLCARCVAAESMSTSPDAGALRYSPYYSVLILRPERICVGFCSSLIYTTL